MCSGRRIHRAILGLASTLTPLTVRRRDRLRPDSDLAANLPDMPRGSRSDRKVFAARLVPGAVRESSRSGGAGAFVGSTRSTYRIGSDDCDVRLEAIERILSIFPIWPRPRPRGARRLNTMSWVDRQAQWSRNPVWAPAEALRLRSEAPPNSGFPPSEASDSCEEGGMPPARGARSTRSGGGGLTMARVRSVGSSRPRWP
jgi:hypothetical protein